MANSEFVELLRPSVVRKFVSDRHEIKGRIETLPFDFRYTQTYRRKSKIFLCYTLRIRETKKKFTCNFIKIYIFYFNIKTEYNCYYFNSYFNLFWSVESHIVFFTVVSRCLLCRLCV